MAGALWEWPSAHAHNDNFKVAVAFERRGRACFKATHSARLAHCGASGLRAPQASGNGALRHK